MNNSDPEQTSIDPVIAEVRQARDAMARESDYDLHKLCERLRAVEATLAGRIHAPKLVGRP